ncbi:hypothetical protein NL676_018099 [Syzygium grande]|nr:hypothetical protein NL676_018099 [Syzygium grande]
MSCFSFVCSRNIMKSKVYEQQPDLETFVVPGLPDQIELTRAQLPSPFNHGSIYMVDLREEIVVNTFEDLEKAYVQEYRKTKGNKVWCVGPVSLCNEGDSDKAHRGNESSINEGQCLKWLDSWPPSSVIYTCLGSLSCLTAPRLIELGSGLEATGRPFIWTKSTARATKGVSWLECIAVVKRGSSGGKAQRAVKLHVGRRLHWSKSVVVPSNLVSSKAMSLTHQWLVRELVQIWQLRLVHRSSYRCLSKAVSLDSKFEILIAMNCELK